MPQHPTSAINSTHALSESRASVKSPRSPGSPFDPLAAALSSVQAKYTLSNPQSLEAHNEACEDFPGGNTRTVLHSSPFPLTFGEQFKTHLSFVSDGNMF